MLLDSYICFLYCLEIGIIMLFWCLILLFLTIDYLFHFYVIMLIALLAIDDFVLNLIYFFHA